MKMKSKFFLMMVLSILCVGFVACDDDDDDKKDDYTYVGSYKGTLTVTSPTETSFDGTITVTNLTGVEGANVLLSINGLEDLIGLEKVDCPAKATYNEKNDNYDIVAELSVEAAGITLDVTGTFVKPKGMSLDLSGSMGVMPIAVAFEGEK